jgi:hypothetical protein
MSPPDPISPGSSTVLPNPNPPTDHPVVSPPPPPPPATTQFSLRGGYRMTYGGEVLAHGFQLIAAPRFRLSPNFTLVLQYEGNFMLASSDKPPASLTRDAVLGSNFAGVRNSRFDGTTYSDVSGGSAIANQGTAIENIFEIQFYARPVADFPFEIGVRAGAGLVWANVDTTTTVSTTGSTGGHTGSGGCIPGDIHCGDGSIPEPTAGAGYGPFHSSASSLTGYFRFGPRIQFPVNDYFQIGTEYLFRTNATNGLDGFWRTNIRLAIPFGSPGSTGNHFLIFADPRFILSNPQDKPVAPGFDMVIGIMGRT